MIVGFCLYFILKPKKRFILCLVIYISLNFLLNLYLMKCIALDQGYEIQQQDQG